MVCSCVKTLEAQVKDADAKYAKMVESAAQEEQDLRLRIISLESPPTAEMNRLERLEKGCVDVVADGEVVSVDRQKAYDATRSQLRGTEKHLCAVDGRGRMWRQAIRIGFV